MKKVVTNLLLIIFFALPAIAKGPPPGTGVGDVKANIMIMLDDSGSMSARDPSPGLSHCNYDIDVATNGDIFAADPCYRKVSRISSAYKVKATLGGTYNYYNNTNGYWGGTYTYGLSLDQADSTDEYVYIGTYRQRGRGSFSGFSNLVKVCTGITTTAACPKAGKVVATNTQQDNQYYGMQVEVQGNYVYMRTHGSGHLYKYNKSDLSLVTKRTDMRNNNNF